MAATIPVAAESPREHSIGAGTAIGREWPIYAVLFSSAAIVLGLIWDISWHRTIGRDTFWSPPHVIEQIGAVVAGLSCGYVVLKTTFAGTADERARSVRFWRFFYGPLGAWVCIWGTITMITSAPFDDWWHNAYGLDVTIISPPHMVLLAGMVAIQLGAMLMALGAQNRAPGNAPRRSLALLFTLASALVIEMVSIVMTEHASFANTFHGARFYIVTSLLIPVFLVAFARASRVTWPATRIAVVYMLITMIAIWVLQLVPARPLLAPIYNPVTTLRPPAFPLLLVFPAIAIDLLLVRKAELNDWLKALLIGASFVAVMLAVHWLWAEFMLSPYARNYFFGADQWDYSSTLGSWRYQYWNLDTDATGTWSAALFAKRMAIALVIAILSTRAGLAWGRGMARVKR